LEKKGSTLRAIKLKQGKTEMFKTKMTLFLLIASFVFGQVEHRPPQNAQIPALDRDVPTSIHYQGNLVDADGDPISGAVEMNFRLFDNSNGGNQLWEQTIATTVEDGKYQVLFGDLTSEMFVNSCWLQITINGEILEPRITILPAPMAMQAEEIGGLDATEIIHYNSPNYVMVGSAGNPAKLDVYGKVWADTLKIFSQAEFFGAVTAGAFVGDGSQLTGIETGEDTDWTESGNDIYHETGNVGIGTNDPTESLDIVGNLKVDDIYNHDGLLSLHSDGSTVVNLGPNGGFLGSWFIVKGPDDNTVFMVSQVGPSFFYGDMSVDGSAQFSGGDGAVHLWLKADIDNAGGESEHPTMSFSQDGGDVVGNLGFFDDYGQNDFAMYNNYSGGGLSFGAGDSKALEIDSDHNFHITRPDGIKTVKIEASENGSDGSQIVMYDGDGDYAIVLDAESAYGALLDFYGNGTKRVRIQATESDDASDGGQIVLYKADGTESIILDAEYGGAGGDGRIFTEVLQITGGSDLAEPFDIKNAESVRPGMLLSIDTENPGKLKLSEKPYDRCVAGIVSGAGGINAGMIMGQAGSVADGEYPVALTGRVYCYSNASNGAIQPGDLLTTSDISGYAMKVTDFESAQGAIIGKAMTGLETGEGLVLVLVSLQ